MKKLACACSIGLLALIVLREPRVATAQTATGPVTTAQAAMGRITGDVTDHRGTPLAGTSVVVTNAAGKQVSSSTTNANGVFTVDSLPEGEYILTFDAKGFYKKTEKAKVKQGKTTKIHTRLKFIMQYS